ncbi:hypothetical protein ABZ357_01340 [Streptomyces sp. NPDC005917]|uniref:hypothetical protein n=1 Tax=unclassified Streptomyces TaxID=2593676 RepID=UPI0033FEE47D
MVAVGGGSALLNRPEECADQEKDKGDGKEATGEELAGKEVRRQTAGLLPEPVHSGDGGPEPVHSGYRGPEDVRGGYRGPEDVRGKGLVPGTVRSGDRRPKDVRGGYRGPEDVRGKGLVPGTVRSGDRGAEAAG